MAIAFVCESRLHDFTVVGSPVTAKSFKQVGDRVGVVQGAAPVGERAILDTLGTYSGVAKLSTDDVADGVLVYWDNGNSRLTLTATSNISAGYSVGAFGNGVATMTIALHGGKK